MKTETEARAEEYAQRLAEVKAAILEGRAYVKSHKIVRFNDWTGFALVEMTRSGQTVRRSFPVGKGLEAIKTIKIK